jgi:AAA+ ATPase superfamily predicted ATPase
MLIDRESELEELNLLLAEPRASLLAVTGRRRLGKTTLLAHWAQASGQPYLYWVASRAPDAILLREFSQLVWRQAHPGDEMPADFSYDTWESAFRQTARLAEDRRFIVILDEFPYAVESNHALPSILQNAWDHSLKPTRVLMVLCGSYIGMMEQLMHYQAPLYGRMVGPLRVAPLPFSALQAFFPRYSAEQRVAVYAMLGGVPAYLERFDDGVSLADNVRRHLFRETGLFRVDPDYLLQDAVREPQQYLAVLLAIAAGQHRPVDIASMAGMKSANHLDPYLVRLRDLGFIRRETPATVPPVKQATARNARYVLEDNYLRFYFRFIWPERGLLEQRLYDRVWATIEEGLRGFVGLNAFEELSRQWVLHQARLGKLPFLPEQVGSHWSPEAQVDVVAISWREKAILLGEAKWGPDPVGQAVIRELAAKSEKVAPGEDWQVHYAFFARSGFTEPAQAEARRLGASLVDLARLDNNLGKSKRGG